MEEHGINDAAKRFGRALDRFGRLWNDYEVRGMEKIPRDRASLLVVYHGFFPLDVWYFFARFWLETGRIVRGLGDRWLFLVPGLERFLRHIGTVPGNRDDAIRLLRNGHTVLVSPGGVREALEGPDDFYKVIWGERLGFAKVAIETGVDLVPIFTENVEAVYRAPGASSAFLRRVFKRTRLPIVPIVGMGPMPWPVKLRTWVGDPITCESSMTAEQLRDKVSVALQDLIDTHQKTPWGLYQGLADRLD